MKTIFNWVLDMAVLFFSVVCHVIAALVFFVLLFWLPLAVIAALVMAYKVLF
jgi:hypothetical protein